ncbi:MAG: hypothetical protein ABR924_01715, partial [Terracidiphilus sp.]|jgi:hypothetical protein
MTAFRTRRSEAGDEPELNAVFNRFVSDRDWMMQRPLDLMRWIWHQAPGGPVDSWVIETQDSTGWRIIGHHALCPVRFTRGDEDWLCAKTINSFLLPEFRDKFLYLRFEQECLREADARFDATYSFAPRTARLRRALGYERFGTWIELERGFQPLHLIYRTAAYFTGRHSYCSRRGRFRKLASILAAPMRKPPFELTEHAPAEAASSSFFADFWAEARREAGMAPRRDAADLDWRFWKRPGPAVSTLTYTWPEGGRAYFIVDTATNPSIHSLVDFFITPANPQRLECLLDALFVWCARRGALALGFSTMAEGLPPQLLPVFLRKMKPFALRRYGAPTELPRRLSPLGRARSNGTLPAWNATRFLGVG